MNRHKKERKSAKERLREFYENFEKNDNVLICITADPDSLACALAVKKLLRYKTKSMVIACSNKISRLSNISMIERLKIKVEPLEKISLKNFNKRVLLDSQPDHLPQFQKIRFDVVIDHHPVNEVSQAGFVDIRDYGAAASMLVEYLRAAKIKPSVALATALFYGIKVDTRNFEKESRLADVVAFRYLYNIANKNLIRKFELTVMRKSELNYFKLALSELNYSKRRFYTHIGRVPSPDILVVIADFINHVENGDWVFVSGIYGDKLVVIFRCDGYRKNAGKLARKMFSSLGSAGGHREAARAEITLKNLDLGDKVFTSDTLQRLTTVHLK